MHRPHHLDGAGLDDGRAVTEQRLVEASELAGRTAHRGARFDLGDVPRLVVDLVDVVREHPHAAVLLDDRESVALPGHGHQTVTERRLDVERDPERRRRAAEGLEDLVVEVAVDRPAVDRLDDRAEHLPAR